MGLHSIANVCAHLQNASRARLGLTSLPNTKYNLRLLLAMHRAGLIATLTRAGPEPPAPEKLLEFEPDGPVTTKNVASRRLWVGLKYWNDKPVISQLQLISRSSRKVSMTLSEMRRLSVGHSVGPIMPLAVGEVMFCNTDLGTMELREAIAKRRGGIALCRIR